MQAQQITGQVRSSRILEIALSALVVLVLVVAFIVATLGLGFEGHVGHGPMPAPVALEAH